MPAPLPPVDPAVKIPAAVRAAATRAEELVRGPAPATPPADPAPPVVDPAPAPAPADTAVTQPGNSPAPAPEAAPAPASENWEHKYNSMKGRYDRLNDRFRQLEGVVASLQSAPPTQPSAAPTEPLITPDERNSYGDEFLSVVGKRAREELMPVVASVTNEVKQLQTNMKQAARMGMHQVLDAQIQNWRDINTSDEFLDWLDLPDTYSGAKRISLLKAAYEQSDTPRVLAFFKGFLAEEAAQAPATTAAAPTPGTDIPSPAPKVPLIELAAPGRAKSAATPVPAEKPIITRSQISQFYVDSAQGKYRGRDDEKAALEKMIFEAQRDGRIR